MAKVLIIGGTGFIGQYLVQQLSQEHTVSVVGRHKHQQNFIDIQAILGVTVTYGFDTLDITTFGNHFEDKDIVIHLAGMVSFRQKDAQKLIDVNHTGALNVLHACEKYGVKKFIHISSTAALGFSDHIIDEVTQFQWEKYKKCVYSYSKSLSNADIRESSCPFVILYPSLVLGPGDATNTRQLMDALGGKKIPFHMPGANSYVDVRDLVQAIMLVMDPKICNEEFIVSTQNYSYAELDNTVADVLGVAPPKWTLPRFFAPIFFFIFWIIEKLFPNTPLTYENVFMSFQNRRHSSEKIRSIGWKPRYTLTTTFQDAQKISYE